MAWRMYALYRVPSSFLCFPRFPDPVGTLLTRGNNLKTCFSYMGQNVKKNILGYLGGPGGPLTSNQGERKFQGRKTSSQSRHMHNKGKNNQQFSYIGHNIIFLAFLAIRGGGGGAWVAHK